MFSQPVNTEMSTVGGVTPDRHAPLTVLSIEDITPEMAAAWLLSNPKNRPIRAAQVARLAESMRRGEWVLNGESIKFSTDALLDGQHRLAAIVESGISIQSVVIRGLSSTVQETVDLGTRRTVADMLMLRDEHQSRDLAAALVIVHLWRRHGRVTPLSSATYPTPQELFELLEAEPTIRGSLYIRSEIQDLVGYPPALAIALHHLMAQIDSEDADDFWHRLGKGVRLNEGSPILALRKQAFEGKARRNRNRAKLAAITIKAWNAFRYGEPIRRLRYREGDKFPIPR